MDERGGEGRRRDKGNVIQHTSYGETEKPGKKCVRVGPEPRTSGVKVKPPTYSATMSLMQCVTPLSCVLVVFFCSLSLGWIFIF